MIVCPHHHVLASLSHLLSFTALVTGYLNSTNYFFLSCRPLYRVFSKEKSAFGTYQWKETHKSSNHSFAVLGFLKSSRLWSPDKLSVVKEFIHQCFLPFKRNKKYLAFLKPHPFSFIFLKCFLNEIIEVMTSHAFFIFSIFGSPLTPWHIPSWKKKKNSCPI